MKETLKKQLGWFSPDQAEWYEYELNCIAADICPKCGCDLISYEKIVAKGPIESTFFECPTCDWQKYAQ